MKPRICDNEQALLTALKTGYISNELLAHLGQCPICNESRFVWDCLEKIASAENHAATLPSAGLIWWRAQLLERKAIAERSVAAIDVVQNIATILATIVLGALSLWWGIDSFNATPTMWGLIASAFVLLLLSSGAVLYAWARERI